LRLNTPNPGPDHGYIPALDGVRAIAISAVLVTHSFPDFTPELTIAGVLNNIAAGGAFGVDLFFVFLDS